MRDELCELIEDHKRTSECIVTDRNSPADVKPKVSVVSTAVTTSTTFNSTMQRPTNFATTFSNNNNNNMINANNRLSLKIKAEPIEELYEDEQPLKKKRCEM